MMTVELSLRRYTGRKPCRTVYEGIHRHQVAGRSLSDDPTQVSTATTFLDGGAPPNQTPAASRALFDEKTAVEGASRHKAKVPHRPPDWVLAQAARTDAGTAIVELVSRHDAATKHPLRESPGSFDGSIAHGQPLLQLETQDMSDGLLMIFAVEVGGVS